MTWTINFKKFTKMDGMMENSVVGIDPWSHMIRRLDTESDLLDSAFLPDRSGKLVLEFIGSPDGTKVKIVGRSTSRSITVMWCNSTIGYFGAQLWHLVFARQAGICQISGESIQCGDSVFRPRGGSSPPINANAMILARFAVFATDDAFVEYETV